MHTDATTHYADSAFPHSYTPPRVDAVAATAPYLHTLLRVGAALLFLEHGLQKLFGMFGGMGPGGHVDYASQMGFAGILELGGGLLLAIGLLTRPVALILAVEMIWAFLQAHLPRGGMPIQNGGELALLYACVFLFLVGFGAGPLSVDSGIGKSPVVVH